MYLFNYHQTPLWFSQKQLWQYKTSQRLRSWLLDKGSLTKRLKSLYECTFTIQVTLQAWQYPSYDELILLALPKNQLVLTREVILMCNGKKHIFARSLFPKQTLEGNEKLMLPNHHQSLGELLFTQHNMKRHLFEIAELTPEHYYYQRAVSDLPSHIGNLWARRSVFYIKQKPLLVSEVFLPFLDETP
ncbi:MAG: chorismate lyase [Gammaproteobacteria bacterium]|nr:chorismate lyase [Gammaproteobacteria bacterium]